MAQVSVQTSITLLTKIFLLIAQDASVAPTILQELGIFVFGLLLPFIGRGTKNH